MNFLKNTYILKLDYAKNLNRLLKYHVHFIKIKYNHDACFLYVDKENYDKLVHYFEIYNIFLYKITGLHYYRLLIKKYYIFIISTILGIMFLYLLSNIIFKIEIMTNKKDLIEIITNELESSKLSKYRFGKSYSEKEKIKNNILTKYKNKIEWLEIDRVGSKYYVRVLERIINNKEEDIKYQNVVAKRNAIILEIKSGSGQIVKKVNDYVNKGDVIISGNITKKDEVKDRVKAMGKIYGETWYNVRVELPKTYNNITRTGNSYNRYTIDFFNNKLFLFGKKDYKNEEYVDKKIISNKLLPFSLNKTTIYELKSDVLLYTYSDALSKGMMIARDKLLDNLGKNSKILEQKKLKLYEENSKIIIEVFFKVYEDITDYEEIMDGE